MIALRAKQIVVYPTETFYGIGADAFAPAALEQIFAVKGRDAAKTIALIAHDEAMAFSIAARSTGRGATARESFLARPVNDRDARTVRYSGIIDRSSCDLSWIWRVAADYPNLLFDTAWWMPADLYTLFSLVPPGQILFASDAPYGQTGMSASFMLRTALQVGLSTDQIRSIASEQALRIAAGEPLQPMGAAIGERERASHALLDRVSEFLLLGTIASMRGLDAGAEMLALARLACDVPDEIDDAPVFAAIRHLINVHDDIHAADPADRRRLAFLILALTTARTPDVPVPAFSRRRDSNCGPACSPLIALPDQPQPDQRQQIVDLVDRLAYERHERVGEPAGRDHRRRRTEFGAQAPDDPLDLAGEPVDDPAADRVDRRLSDQRARLGQFDLRQLRCPLIQRIDRDLRSGADDAAEVLAGARDRVVRDRGAEVDDHARVPHALVRGDRVDEPVGAHLAGVVDPDRHSGPDRRSDHEHLVPEIAASHRRPLLGELGHGRGDDRGVDVVEPESAQRKQVRQRRAQLVARRLADGRKPPVLGD